MPVLAVLLLAFVYVHSVLAKLFGVLEFTFAYGTLVGFVHVRRLFCPAIDFFVKNNCNYKKGYSES